MAIVEDVSLNTTAMRVRGQFEGNRSGGSNEPVLQLLDVRLASRLNVSSERERGEDDVESAPADAFEESSSHLWVEDEAMDLHR